MRCWSRAACAKAGLHRPVAHRPVRHHAGSRSPGEVPIRPGGRPAALEAVAIAATGPAKRGLRRFRPGGPLLLPQRVCPVRKLQENPDGAALRTRAHLPFPADEMLVDFSVLDGSGASPGETEVLTVAVERQRLAPILAALAAVKIEPERVTLSGFAAAAWIGTQPRAGSDRPLPGHRRRRPGRCSLSPTGQGPPDPHISAAGRRGPAAAAPSAATFA